MNNMVVREPEILNGGFWESWWAFAFVTAPFTIGILSFLVCLHISNRHLDTMLDALKNSRHIVIHGAGLRHQGWFGRVLLATKIGGVVLFSGPLVRIGEMDADDVRNFPEHLRRLLKVHAMLLFSSILWGGAVYVALKLK